MALFNFSGESIVTGHRAEGVWFFVKAVAAADAHRSAYQSVVASVATIDGRCERIGQVGISQFHNALSIVERVAKFLETRPDCSTVSVMTDEANFYRALPPNDDWLRSWVESRFRKPAVGRMEWSRLNRLCSEKRILLLSPEPSCAEDRVAIEQLKTLANSYERPRGSIEPEDDDLDEETETLMQRAIERDR